MMRKLLILVLVLLTVALVFAQRRGRRGSSAIETAPLAQTERERQILTVIDKARQEGEEYLNVPDTDGRMLRLLTEAAGAQHVVEIGTSTGFSALWIAMALEKTGGELTTFEIDSRRAAIARENFREAGVDSLITVVEGDAHRTVEQLEGPIDVVFIDADKDGYTDYLEKLLPLVRPGGLILAHNINSADAYAREVVAMPELDTILYSDGSGMSITLKKR
jgi:predicted O-methyltransferase YrrM